MRNGDRVHWLSTCLAHRYLQKKQINQPEEACLFPCIKVTLDQHSGALARQRQVSC